MNFTDSAIDQFKKLIDENENPKAGIRFYTVQGCCSPSLQMGVAENLTEGDKALQIKDINVFISDDAEKMLSEITIDYTKEGFRATNTTNAAPNE